MTTRPRVVIRKLLQYPDKVAACLDAAVLWFAVLAATRLYLALGFVVLSVAWIMQMSSHGFWGIAAIVGLYVVGCGLIAIGCYRYRQLPYPEPERYKKVAAPLAVIGWLAIAFSVGAAGIFALWQALK